MTRTSIDIGEQFETEVAALLALRPDTTVRRHERLAGKDVDLVIQQRDLLGEKTVVVECKAHATALPREKVVKIWSDYQPIIDANQADGLLIVTRNGIVANAASALSGLPAHHVTERDLFESSFPIERLLRHAEQSFAAGNLRSYYQPLEGYHVSIDLATAAYAQYYGEMADYCLANFSFLQRGQMENGQLPRVLVADRDAEPSRRVSVNWLVSEWSRAVGTDYVPLSKTECDELLEIFADRTSPRRCLLDQTVDDWLNFTPAEGPTGLAILGSYGTGKSSFARALAHRLASDYRAQRSQRVPLLIELRHFGSHQSIEGLVADELSNRHGFANGSFLTFQELNRSGRFVIILDGFDEMKEGMSRDALAYNFSELNQLQVAGSRVILCGRPTVFESQDEQRRMLSGASTDAFHTGGRYIQVEIASMQLEQTRSAIRQYVKVQHDELSGDIQSRIAELETELERNAGLRDLLSRPVHFPMLLQILPQWRNRLGRLTRSELYGAFIARTIARELKPGRPPTISAEQREQFASDLAVSMFALGDSRSIRYGLIPADIVRVHRRGTEPLEAVQRDLIRACFLERKAPDVLFFPHKSFGEYLVARRFLRDIREGAVRTDAFGVTLTTEIAAFLGEVLTSGDWTLVLSRAVGNLRLVRFFCAMIGYGAGPVTNTDPRISLLALEDALAQEGAFSSMLDDGWISDAPEMLLFHLASALEAIVRSGDITDEAEAMLWRLLNSESDIAAVHAFRALATLSPTIHDDIRKTHPKRWTEWSEKGWLRSR